MSLREYPHTHDDTADRLARLEAAVGQLQRVVVEQAVEIELLRGRGAWLADALQSSPV